MRSTDTPTIKHKSKDLCEPGIHPSWILPCPVPPHGMEMLLRSFSRLWVRETEREDRRDPGIFKRLLAEEEGEEACEDLDSGP